MKVSFLNSAGKPESWKYQGGSWAVANFIKEADGGNKILEWAGDAATTRKQVSANERKGGMQISYKPDGEDWVNEQYVGASFSDNEWAKDSNWQKIATQSQIDGLQENQYLLSDVKTVYENTERIFNWTTPSFSSFSNLKIKEDGTIESYNHTPFRYIKVTPGKIYLFTAVRRKFSKAAIIN